MINSIMILDFWFKECTPKMWFKKDKEFDNLSLWIKKQMVR